MIASDLVTSSLLLLGVISAGETPSTDEAATGLTALQQLLDSWSADELIVHATRTAQLTMNSGTLSYSIPGARPVKILSADTVTGGQTFPVEVAGPDKYAQYDDRSAVAARVRMIYCDYAYPTPAVYVAPTPNFSAGYVNLYCMVDLATLATGGTTFSMPEAYARAVRFNLALDLAGEYGRVVPDSVIKGAVDSKNALKTLIASDRAGKSELAVPPIPGA